MSRATRIRNEKNTVSQVVELRSGNMQTKNNITFADLENHLLKCAVAGLRHLNPDEPQNFSGAVRLISNFFPVPFIQRDLAALLCVTPVTLQRWAKGSSLPSLLPRRAYFGLIVDTLTELADMGPEGDAGAVFAPRFDDPIDFDSAVDFSEH